MNIVSKNLARGALLISHVFLHIPAGVRGRPAGGAQVRVGGVSPPIGREGRQEARSLAETMKVGGVWGMYRPVS